MNRQELEHLIRAASSVTDQYEIMIIGSQSILGAIPNAPAELLKSMEADMYSLGHPELSDLIDGSIGEMSPFDNHFGYYAQGVDETTAILPDGWKNRLWKIQNDNTLLRIGYCLDPSDLAASKLAAGRDKDWEFVSIMLSHQLVDNAVLLKRISALPVEDHKKVSLSLWVNKFVPAGNETKTDFSM